MGVTGDPSIVSGKEEVSYVVLGVTNETKMATLAACGNFDLDEEYLATEINTKPVEGSKDSEVEAEITLPSLGKGQKSTYYAFIAARVYLKQIDEIREYRYTKFTISYERVYDSNTWTIVLAIGLISCLVIVVGYLGNVWYRRRKAEINQADLSPELLTN
eukprot:TRINITY_DN5211_c0_g1_i2.p1 TRINITY_DN5211_c0_g1~~TRINITY_DN5211_c0_g1_i2.p1  ORF type:complete len:160 (+),score=37.04 TRINITY_DN5211_c0_g1_i2:41-520(+)